MCLTKRYTLTIKLLTVVLFSTLKLVGQQSLTSNPLWSQSYHNPAFTGWSSTNRIYLNSRSQWLGIGDEYALFNHQVIGFDAFIDQYHAGIGVQFVNEKMGPHLDFYSVSSSVSKVFPLPFKGNLTVGGGLNTNVLHQNDTGPTFIDQYGLTGQISPSNDVLASFQNTTQTQMGVQFGLLLEGYSEMGDENIFNQTGYQLGFSVKTIPFLNNNLYTKPYYFTYSAGMRYGLNDNESILMGWNALVQQFGNMYQSTVGINFGYYEPETIGVNLGLKYRGRPLKKYQDAQTMQSDAIIGTLDFIPNKNFRFGIAYDLPVNSLRNQTPGSFEFGLWYVFDGKKYRDGKGANGVDLRRISAKNKETECDQFRNLFAKYNNRKKYYLWP
jgi:type IX secretion system PorP/SprF family membrane protein